MVCLQWGGADREERGRQDTSGCSPTERAGRDRKDAARPGEGRFPLELSYAVPLELVLYALKLVAE
jgi:hypothetical protein